jgi:predicted nucleic acid-binding protein
MKIIADTGPLIGLAKIDCLFILKHIASEVYIPNMVYRELMGKVSVESERIEEALNDFIQINEIKSLETKIKNTVEPKIREKLMELGEGERQAIILTFKFSKNFLLLLDDRDGRSVADKLNIPYTGLIGILLLAKEKGLLKHIGPLIDDLRTHGYWISDEIADMSKRLAGEEL